MIRYLSIMKTIHVVRWHVTRASTITRLEYSWLLLLLLLLLFVLIYKCNFLVLELNHNRLVYHDVLVCRMHWLLLRYVLLTVIGRILFWINFTDYIRTNLLPSRAIVRPLLRFLTLSSSSSGSINSYLFVLFRWLNKWFH